MKLHTLLGWELHGYGYQPHALTALSH